MERFPSESVLSKAKIKAERIDKQFSNQCVVYLKKGYGTNSYYLNLRKVIDPLVSAVYETFLVF